MLNKYLKKNIPAAKRLVAELGKTYEYVSILGSHVLNKRIVVGTANTSVNELESECGFVIKVYKDGRYSEYSCDSIADLKAADVLKAVRLKDVCSSEFRVAMLEEKEHTEDFLREDPDRLSNREIIRRLTEIKDAMHKEAKVINTNCVYAKRETSKIFVSARKCLTQKYDWMNAMLMVVTRDGDNIKSNYHAEGEASSLKVLDMLKKNSAGVLDIAVRLLDAEPIKPGK